MRSTVLQQEIEQIPHAAPFAIRDRIELLKRLFLTIDPESRIAEEFSARRVPAPKGRTKDFLAVQLESIDHDLVGSGWRFVDANRIRTEPVFKEFFKTGAADVSVEHCQREIVK